MAERRRRLLKKPALRILQNRDRPLYLLSLTAEELMAVADISRASRKDGKLQGYQRGEVRRHVQDIVTYLNGEDVLLPNSLVVALSSNVTFRAESPGDDPTSVVGLLTIPFPREGEEKPGWIVDGQQRAMALMQSKRSDWPVPVNAFIADDVALQRDQFLRVNNTRPLPRGLITELLPEVSTPLPRKLASKRIPSAFCDLLSSDPGSPFRGLVRRTSLSPEERRAAVVADASLVRMLEESLTTPSGCLFPYHNVTTGETDTDGIWRLLVGFWSAVRDVFPEAWGKPPSRSRLMHGTGIRAMGRLMDRVMSARHPREKNLRHLAAAEIDVIAPHCRWTEGRWEEIGLAWDEVQNVPRHLRLLSNYLMRLYLAARGGAA